MLGGFGRATKPLKKSERQKYRGKPSEKNLRGRGTRGKALEKSRKIWGTRGVSPRFSVELGGEGVNHGKSGFSVGVSRYIGPPPKNTPKWPRILKSGPKRPKVASLGPKRPKVADY
jgi:hypothetical protein